MFAILLGLLGIFVGGCALMFYFDPYFGGDPIQIMLLFFGALCIAGAIALSRGGRKDD